MDVPCSKENFSCDGGHAVIFFNDRMVQVILDNIHWLIKISLQYRDVVKLTENQNKSDDDDDYDEDDDDDGNDDDDDEDYDDDDDLWK